MSAPQTFTPHGRREALASDVLRTALRCLLKPVLSPRCPIWFQRLWLRLMAQATRMPAGVRTESVHIAGCAGEWFLPLSNGATPGITLLYLHGGAYCLGSPATHRALTARLAQASGLRVLSLDYRLAPEHPFPAALQDATAACLALQAQGPVLLAGDSAGGGLALSTALALRDQGLPLPAALLLLAPWADLSPSKPVTVPAGEVMLSMPWAKACAAHYLGGHGADQPGVSPLHQPLHGLPPTLIQVGTDDMLCPQALALHHALQQAGVSSRCEVTAHRWHVFQMHADVLPSAQEAIARLATFAKAQAASAQA
ncbi:alpha/beta hydrolase [Limnohabitans sp. DM1]|uniref:alpha/beta hydrolase n=1 Tax=Limnohabitans sp. DM1 TaxID=1597955 RepID=UPI000A64A0AB|nr:alpha/beta hydrolase [Limnohabitans sp. DM1]